MPKPVGKNGEKNLVSKKIKELRREYGLSQRELAERLQLLGVDIDKNVITRIENCCRYVTDIELRAFSRLFGVSPGRLLGMEKLENN